MRGRKERALSKGVAKTVAAICGLIVIGSVVVCLATGAKPFTRHTDEEIVQANEPDDLDSVFADTGLDEEHGELENVETGFALGWLPSGPGIDALSVATISGPAIIVGGGVLLLARRNSSRASDTDGDAAKEHEA